MKSTQDALPVFPIHSPIMESMEPERLISGMHLYNQCILFDSLIRQSHIKCRVASTESRPRMRAAEPAV